MNNKEKVILYCENIMTGDISYLENCINNRTVLSKKDYNIKDLEGCPMNYGLDDIRGECELERENKYEDTLTMCYECWRKVLF